MSRIYGMNDRVSLEERNFPPFQIQVWKGTKKQGDYFGRDLGLEFRIELMSDNIVPNNSSSALVKGNKASSIRNILKQSYLCREDNTGSLYVKNLNIIPYSDNLNSTFFSALTTFKKNRPLWFCDKKTIHTKFLEETGKPVKTDTPCLAKSPNHDCPKNCKPFGSFYFEILELAHFEIHLTCRLQVSGIGDIIYIADFLEKTQKQYGAIRSSPFFSTNTRTFKVYCLSRIAKTSSYKRTNYPVFLQLHPLYLKEYNGYLAAQELKRQGVSVPIKLLAQIHGSEFFDEGEIQEAEIVEPDWKPKKEDIAIARQLWRGNNWTQEQLVVLLKSRFGINSLKEIQTLSQEQFNQFKEALKK